MVINREESKEENMDYQELMEMAALAGEIMLRSGAEVYRVEDTVSRILRKSRLKHIEVLVLSTGIFATISDAEVPAISVVRRVRDHATNLNRIYEVNNVSRAFCADRMSVTEALRRLEEIDITTVYRFPVKCFGYAMITGFFAVMFSGTLLDSAAAAVIGVILACSLNWFSKLKFNDFFQSAAGSFVLGVSAYLIKGIMFPSMNLDAVIISSIMPLVPGVRFTSAIRDTLNGDYSSGVARIAEAIVVALAVAFGVGVSMMTVRLTGGLV